MSYKEKRDEWTSLSLYKAAELFREKEVSSQELTRSCLIRIERLNPVLNAFITVTAESAMREAAEADAELARGNYRGPLHGIPIALKDLIDTAGVRTTAGSAVYENRIPEEDATVVRRLREAGAVFLGKLNLHEFAYGGSGVISHFGPVRNPWDTARTTGGSSSGSAAAVAAGLCFAALGTDTAGSIRLPASFCGITGFKPTYGLVSAAGVIPLCWSFDHVGPMARCARDAALLLDAIAGYDAADPTSAEFHFQAVGNANEQLPAGLRLGVAGGMFLDGLDREVDESFRTAVQQLSTLLSAPITIELPLEQTNTVRIAEPYAYHASLLEERASLYQPATLERIRAGADVSAAKYLPARRELETMRRYVQELFRDVDIIASPTVPCLPYSIDELVGNPAELRPRELRMLRNTRPFNVLGLPTISVPCGLAGDLPVGVQLAAAPGRDALVLQVAHAFEQRTQWAERLPVEPKMQ